MNDCGRLVPVCLVTYLVCLIGMSGCVPGGLRSETLPANLQARPLVDMQRVDIPAMGVNGIRNDVLYVGDMVECVVKTSSSQEMADDVWEARVASDGHMEVPLVGPVLVAGQTIEQAEERVKQASVDRQVYRNPAIRLSVKQRQMNTISVVGAVAKPGVYDLPSAGSNLVAALTAAGGILPEADELVEIHDPNTAATGVEPVRINMAVASESAQGNVYLNDAAVIRVSQRPEHFVHVMGNTRRNQPIPMPNGRNLRVLDAIAMVGGMKYSNWISDKIVVTRTDAETGETVQINVSTRKAMKDSKENIVLAPGDIINVNENAVTFTLNTVRGLMGVGASAAVSGVRL